MHANKSEAGVVQPATLGTAQTQSRLTRWTFLASALAGQRITLRLDGPVAHVLAAGVIVRTGACPVPPEGRPRLRGARPGTAQQPQLPEPLVVTRRVSVRGSIMVGG
jgi:hypothetical protein